MSFHDSVGSNCEETFSAAAGIGREPSFILVAGDLGGGDVGEQDWLGPREPPRPAGVDDPVDDGVEARPAVAS